MLNHPVHFGRRALARLKPFIARRGYSAVFVLTDTGSDRWCYPMLRPFLPAHTRIRVRRGEATKQVKSCERIWSTLLLHRADRNAVLINVGGGMVCDLGGFAAAVYKRGIDFIHVPTTVAAQADAALGGKTGVDAGPLKNAIGLFKAPAAVWVDPAFLDTLPARPARAGFAEVIKHALIADRRAFGQLSRMTALPVTSARWIRFSVFVKQRIVDKDPYERGGRQALNAGHTVGHALEAYFLGKRKPLLHGEAVAAGLVAEAYIAFRKDLLTAGERDAVTALLTRHYRLPALPPSAFPSLVRLMRNDKKSRSGGLRMALLDGIGAVVTGQAVSAGEVVRSLQHYNRILQR